MDSLDESAFSPAFREALALVRTEPLPRDAFERLEDLSRRIRPAEADRFGDLYESAYAVAEFVPGAPS